MPTLPTITVTDAQAQRILATFGTATRYRNWLRRMLVAEVTTYESAQLATDLGLAPEAET